MQLNLYSLLDTCDGSYELILTSPKDETMIRTLVHVFMTGKNIPLTENYEDKQLFRIGSFDSETGTLVPTKAPIFVKSMSDIYLTAMDKIAKWKLEHGIKEVKEDGKQETTAEEKVNS